MFCRVEGMLNEVKEHWMSCVVPRPIGWISTVSRDGTRNLAPYSFFNAIAENPPMIMFASNGAHPSGPKDTVRNILETGEFVCNLATFDLRRALRCSGEAVPPEVDEFDLACLAYEPSVVVTPVRVKGSPIHIECVYHSSITLPSDIEENVLIIGRVVGVHIDEAVLANGRIDLARCQVLSRVGYGRFATLSETFPIPVA
jgi:flavin reductase (DIM6/NTAB) family NADH-FMN oxidoreductase RutF